MPEHTGQGEILDTRQLQVGENPPSDEEPSFLTDDVIVKRLRAVENGLAHLESQIPSMRREVAKLRGGLERHG